jgi:hypothetical protein
MVRPRGCKIVLVQIAIAADSLFELGNGFTVRRTIFTHRLNRSV